METGQINVTGSAPRACPQVQTYGPGWRSRWPELSRCAKSKQAPSGVRCLYGDECEPDSPLFEVKQDSERWHQLGPDRQASVRAKSSRKSLGIQSRWELEDCEGRLVLLGEYAARKASSRFGGVGRDAIREAGAVAVAAVIEACCVASLPSGRASVDAFQSIGQSFNAAGFMAMPFRDVARIAVNAASRSIRREFVSGQTGCTQALAKLRCVGALSEACERCICPQFCTRDNGGSIPDEMRECFVARVQRAVGEALKARLAGLDSKIAVGRAQRAARNVLAVLTDICSGDSLAVACQRWGYSWDAARSRSMGFQSALAGLGLGAWLTA